MLASESVYSIVSHTKMEPFDTNTLAVDKELLPEAKLLQLSLPNFLKDPRKKTYRYSILFLLCYIHAAVNFSGQSMAGLSNEIILVMEINEVQFELLLSGFSWANTLTSFLGGLIIDNILGNGLSLITAICFSVSGESLIAIGAFSTYFRVMAFGRFILGIGNELQIILMNAYLIVWFSSNEINFAISVSLSAAKLLGAISLLLMQYLYEALSFLPMANYRLGITLSLGVLLFLGSMVTGSLIITLDNNAKVLSKNVVKEKNFLHNVKKLVNADFWIVIAAMGIYFAVTRIGQKYLSQTHESQAQNSNIILSIMSFAIAFITPFIGMLVSITGFKLSWAQAGVVFGLLSHIIYLISDTEHHAITMIAGMMYSLSYSFFFNSMMVVPGEMVSKDQLSTAYGLSNSVQNLLYSFIHLISGVVIDFAGYVYLKIVCLVLLFLVFSMLTVLLTKKNSKLNASNIKRRKKHSRINTAEYPHDIYCYY